MDLVAVGAALPALYDPLQQLVVHGMQFSKEVRLEKVWASIRQAAHVLSGEFTLPAWNVRSSITNGPYLCDLQVSDFQLDTLAVLLLASKFNDIKPGAPMWYPLINSSDHANTAHLVDMGEEIG